MRSIFKVFFGFIALYCCFHAYASRNVAFQAVEFHLPLIIESLADIQSYVRQYLIDLIQTNFCKEECIATTVGNNYDLSKYELQCPHHRYKTRMIERSPLIIYIEQFLTENEIQYLIQLTEPFLQPSMILEENGTATVNKHRTSTSAFIKRHQTPIVKCIEQRFAQFQGDVDVECLEQLQVVKYTGDQQYEAHYDWFEPGKHLTNGGQRVTTYFTYLQANCSMGETEFLALKFNRSWHERFCDILVCDEKSAEHGIRFRPLAGNTIFWYNMDEYGEVDHLTYHAGRPPGPNGRKIGLNTWTRVNKVFSAA